MHKRWIKVLGAALATVCAASPFCAAAEDFGCTLDVDISPYTETAIRTKLEQDKENQLVLASTAQTSYRIVYPNGNAKLMAAAQTLADALTEMTGAEFACVSDTEAETATEIVIGGTSRTAPAFDATQSTDTYRIVTAGEKLFIQGASDRAVTYGVYGFMEDDLGCVFINGAETFIPHSGTVKLAPIDRTETPAMQWRNVYAYETKQSDGWYEKLRLNGIESDPTDEKTESMSMRDGAHGVTPI